MTGHSLRSLFEKWKRLEIFQSGAVNVLAKVKKKLLLFARYEVLRTLNSNVDCVRTRTSLILYTNLSSYAYVLNGKTLMKSLKSFSALCELNFENYF